MAKKSGGSKSSSKSSSEPSNTGLIVTLVFFILATIGLGVTTYMGYGGKADAVKEAKTASDKAAAADKKADEAEARRIGLKIAAGAADPAEQAKFGGLKGTYGSVIASDVAGLFSQLQSQLNLAPTAIPPWNPATAEQPPKSLKQLAIDLQNTANAANAKDKAAQDELAKERDSFRSAVEELQAKLKTAQENLAKASKDVVLEQQTKAGGSDQKDAEIKKLSEDLAQVKLDFENFKTDKERQVTDLKTELNHSHDVRKTLAEKYGPLLEKIDQVSLSRPELRELGELRDLLHKALEGQQSIVNDQPKGAIIQTRPGQVYINLGSADNVQPGLTFSVLPAGSTGRGAAATPRKAAVEVTAVLEPHMSVAKVVEAQNPARDPLLRGDLLFNPAWDVTQKTHIAMAGIFDLNGSGVDGAQDLIRSLEKQGVIVDAWLDLKDRTIKGPGITERTTYLVMGEKPVLPPGLQPDANPLTAAIVDVLGKIDAMQNKAKEMGVTTVQYRRFLSLIGYKLPRGIQPNDLSASSYLRGPGGIKASVDKDKEDKPK